jgi:diguanylate cyclase (GGDEF)-like protein
MAGKKRARNENQGASKERRGVAAADRTQEIRRTFEEPSGADESLTATTRYDRADIERVLNHGPQEFRLVVLDPGPLMGTPLCMVDAPLLIGRDAGCDVVLSAKGVSRIHAVVIPDESGHIIADQGSSNGTFVNKVRVQSQRLSNGDVIFMGAATCKYLSVANPELSYYRYLHETSVKDPLTDQANRRYFDDYIRREIERTRRYARPVSLILIDLDHFKKVNDVHGHLCGDAVLKDVSQRMSARLRRSEFLARYGGEEFAVVVPETALGGALLLAEALCQLVRKHPVHWQEKRIPVTISLGVAQWLEPMNEPADLIAVADRCLYAAKRGGRNRVSAEG